MTSSTLTNYILHAKKFIEYENVSIRDFATVVSNNAEKLIAGEITEVQYQDGIYLDVSVAANDKETLAVTSLNYIKDRILEFYPK